MLYEVITENAIGASTQLKEHVMKLLSVQEQETAATLIAFPVITSYSIHYTKLYERLSYGPNNIFHFVWFCTGGSPKIRTFPKRHGDAKYWGVHRVGFDYGFV